MDAHVGRYQLVESIGEGAMGVVYRAHDPQLGRAVAIKVLREETDERAARLLREAQAMAQLSHPNLVTVFDAGRDANRVFLAMELVDGTSLRAWFESHGLTWRDRLRGVIEAGRGLVAAHEAGVVHRDFKPENVLVDEKGRIKVTDFGLARAELSGAPTDMSLPIHETATGSVFGTPAYMSPEQHAGTGADARSDQFAFAVTAWESVWGQRPFVTESIAALVFAIRDGAIDAPPDVKGIPPRIQQILRRALSVDPAARYPSVAALLTDLETVLGPPAGASPRASRAPIYALIALVVLASGAFAAWQLTRPEGPAPLPDLKPEPDRPPPPDEVFRQVIESHEKELVACYEAAKVKQASGTVGIKFDIAADGHVRGFEITYDEFPGTSIGRCVATEVLKWDFPPGTPAGVNVGINLGRAEVPRGR